VAVTATLERVEEIASDTSATVAERSQRITVLFAQQGAQGVELAVDCLLRTDDGACCVSTTRMQI
jgi:hypothetical protein